MNKVIVIGSGFAGLSVSCFLAKSGFKVTIIEKHSSPGGRARQFIDEGFTFDMGPSWYWMPEVFENFFNNFNKKVTDYYELVRLDPSYSIYFDDEKIEIPADFEELKKTFETIEAGASFQLEKFIEEAMFKYNVAMKSLIHKPGLSLIEFLDRDLILGLVKMDVFTSMKKHVSKYFKNEKLKKIIEFPILFLGAMPKNTPALYSLMNYADIKGGTWFPKNGMFEVSKALYFLAKELGVEFKFNESVKSLEFDNKSIKEVKTDKFSYSADIVVSSADYHFTETKLLTDKFQSYSEKYWGNRVMSPSCILFYIGLNKKLKNIQHHNLFFDTSMDEHSKAIYEDKQWPKNPLFYVNVTSNTNPDTAPSGCENLFFLIPVAAGLVNDNDVLIEEYFNIVVKRFESKIGEEILPNIIYKKSFSVKNFISEYNSFKGNAYGLANTLAQTAVLKPSIKSKKVKNLFYTGQLTVPGPGVPPAIISGQIVAKQIEKEFEINK